MPRVQKPHAFLPVANRWCDTVSCFCPSPMVLAHLIYPCPSSVLILNGRSRWNLCYFTTQQYLSSRHPGTFGLYISKATVHILCYSTMPIIFYCIS